MMGNPITWGKFKKSYSFFLFWNLKFHNLAMYVLDCWFMVKSIGHLTRDEPNATSRWFWIVNDPLVVSVFHFGKGFSIWPGLIYCIYISLYIYIYIYVYIYIRRYIMIILWDKLVQGCWEVLMLFATLKSESGFPNVGSRWDLPILVRPQDRYWGDRIMLVLVVSKSIVLVTIIIWVSVFILETTRGYNTGSSLHVCFPTWNCPNLVASCSYVHLKFS